MKHFYFIQIADVFAKSLSGAFILTGHRKAPLQWRHMSYITFQINANSIVYHQPVPEQDRTHQIFALLAICKGNPPVTNGFPSHGPVTSKAFPCHAFIAWPITKLAMLSNIIDYKCITSFPGDEADKSCVYHCVLSPVTGMSLRTCTVGFCGFFSLLMVVFFFFLFLLLFYSILFYLFFLWG